jgi:hypothetical protein
MRRVESSPRRSEATDAPSGGGATMPTARELRDFMAKIESFMSAMDARVSRLEDALKAAAE